MFSVVCLLLFLLCCHYLFTSTSFSLQDSSFTFISPVFLFKINILRFHFFTLIKHDKMNLAILIENYITSYLSSKPQYLLVTSSQTSADFLHLIVALVIIKFEDLNRCFVSSSLVFCDMNKKHFSLGTLKLTSMKLRRRPRTGRTKTNSTGRKSSF